jgi:RimJ/RimL family protein N-acetyltransferase
MNQPMNQQMNVRVESPFPLRALPRLWHWINSFRDRVADDFAPRTFDEFLDDWNARAPVTRTWGVWRDEELGGIVSILPINPIHCQTHVIFAKRFWGHETTVPALQQVYAQVFAAGVLRISSHVFADNHQLIALARAIGAVEETPPHRPLPACTLRNGQPVAMRIVTLFPEEFERCLGTP